MAPLNDTLNEILLVTVPAVGHSYGDFCGSLMAIDLGGPTSQRVGQMNPPPSEIPLVDVAPPTLKSVQKMNSFHRWIECEDLLSCTISGPAPSLALFASVRNSSRFTKYGAGNNTYSPVLDNRLVALIILQGIF